MQQAYTVICGVWYFNTSAVAFIMFIQSALQ